MANKRTAASQAIKDMLNAQIEVSMFNGKINYNHYLNEIIGITEKWANERTKVSIKPKVKVEIEIYVNYQVPEALKPALVKMHRRNPDGTIAIFDDEWDND